ncbi:MAG: helix-turn-helix transcriptional regulator [Clostridia bacterium]|nr:helix-turn-helix transcriptional regulator [Clostridia bacterium]
MRIKELRQEKELTQIDIAKGINTSQRNISRWENGENEPSSSFVIKLAKYFDVSTDYLLGITSDDNAKLYSTPTAAPMGESLTASERKLLSDFRQLSPYLQGIALNTVCGLTGAGEVDLHKKA